MSRESWPELQPYVDTCLLPVTGLTGMESPWEATETLEKLRDVIDRVEIPFRGRIVTYPAVQYGREDGLEAVDKLCLSLRESGFRFVIAVSAGLRLDGLSCPHLSIGPDHEGDLPDSDTIRERIRGLWMS